MPNADRHDYRRGLAMSALGMVIISPDVLLLRLIQDAGTWDVVFWRMLFQGTALLGWLALRGERPLARVARLGRWGWLSALCLSGGQIGFVLAIENTSAANALVLLATMPLFGAALGWLLLRERVAPRTRFAIAVALAGILAIFADSLGRGGALGDAFAVGTALLYAINLVILRRAGDAIVLPGLAVSGLIAAMVALPQAQPLAVPLPDLAILAWIGLVQLPLALVLFFGGTRFVPAAEVALMSLIETALGPYLVWLGVGEVPARAAFFGGALVIAAIAANSLLALRPSRRVPQS
ncbi:DMT family transporter [Arenibaculum sp.]|uniref:DMT family transporter n=1 Tax=Arenibaculum sp. TaxID=2865862 RepID=UPI002E0D2A02|nr:DMT family transporter [Arenibaculum sp.]